MLRLPRFIRQFIRRNTLQKNPLSALHIRSKISIVYMLITWNLLGFVVYKAYRGDWLGTDDTKGLDGGRYYAELLKAPNAVVIKYDGLTKVGRWDLEEEKAKYGRYLTPDEVAAVDEDNQRQAAQDQQE